jgi:hypothetical protein
VISLALHGGLIAATWFTWNHMVQPTPESHAVPVDLIITKQTNIRAEAPPQPPEKIEIPKEAIDQPPMPPPPDVEPAPEPPVPQFKIVQPKTKVDQPDQPKTRKQQIADADAVLNKILAQAKVPPNAKAGPRIIQGVGNQSLATADLAAALFSMIKPCWNPPIGAPNPNDLVVDFELQLNSDGTVMGRPQLSGNSASAMGNPYTRAAAEAAMRAIYQCAPYKLPAARYNDWHDSITHFDPRQMMQ